MRLFFLFGVLCLLPSCSSDKDFLKGKIQLENQGYTDVKMTGYAAFCCGEDDSMSTGFECKDAKGRVLSCTL
jgi:hypothetical protein